MIGWQAKSAVPPPGYAYGPSYRPSLLNALRAIAYIVIGRPRSLAHDTSLLMWDLPITPIVRGLDNVPEEGPLVIVANHYERPGLWMAWPAVFVGNCVLSRTGRDTHWIAIEEWESFQIAGMRISRKITRTVFQRAFSTWGMLAMPRPDTSAAARAKSMRAATQEIRAGHIIGLMPEGSVGPTPELLEAREGVGAFLHLMAAAGARILPVGIYEENERMVAHFGEPYTLSVPRNVEKSERDRWVREHVMYSIRDLLPEPLWGHYRTDRREQAGVDRPYAVQEAAG